MKVGDLVCLKGGKSWGVALITKFLCRGTDKAESFIRWTEPHPERGDFMWIYPQYLEVLSESR